MARQSTAKRVSIEDARGWYPATERCIYMDVANQGLISTATRRSFDAHLDRRLTGDSDEMEMLDHVERTAARFAEFINAEPDEVAVVKNVSEGLGLIASAFLWEAGDSVILAPEVEHANNVFPWYNLHRRYGIEVRTVPMRDGHIPVDAMIDAMDERTRIVTVSTVTMVPGFRTDVPALARACRERDVFLLADAVQSVGILDTDVVALGLDGLATSTIKGLMGLYGMGFLYCRRPAAERLTPPYVSRFSVDLGDAPESAGAGAVYRLRPGAKRFEAGAYNFPAALAAHTSLGELMAVGTDRIEAHVTDLSHRLALGLLDLGLPVAGGEPGPHLANLVCLGDPAGPEDARVGGLHAFLMDNGVIQSVRRGMLRFSLHLYNTAEEVERVVELAAGYLHETRRRSA